MNDRSPPLPPWSEPNAGGRPGSTTGRRPVGIGEATMLSARALSGSIATRGRLLALGAFSFAIVAIAALVAHNQDGSTPAEALRSVDVTVFGIALPLFVLFAAAAGLGEANTEGSLVFLWLRPISRWSIAFGAWIATAATATPFAMVISAVVPLMFGVGLMTVLGALAAGLAATWAYAALFSLFGSLTRFSTPIGLAYILVWESVIGRWGTIPSNLSIRHHAVSIAAGIASVRVSGGVPSAAMGLIVLTLATAGLLGLTTLRLQRMNVR